MFFQFEILIAFSRILQFTVVLFQAIGFLGLITVGITRTREKSIIEKSFLLIIVGSAEFIYLVINERIFNLIFGLQGVYTLELLAIQDALNYLVPNIISMMTFGGLFLYLGIRNKQNFGRLLVLSAICRIIGGIILIFPYNITSLANLSLPITLQDLQLAYMIIPIASISVIISYIFLLRYTLKINVKLLFYASILLLVASSLFFVKSIIQFIIIIS